VFPPIECEECEYNVDKVCTIATGCPVLAIELLRQQRAAKAAVAECERTGRIAERVTEEWNSTRKVTTTRTTKIPRAIVHTGVHRIPLDPEKE
jgi:hypothetical protein